MNFGRINSLGVFSIFIAWDIRHVSPQILETLGEHEHAVYIALPTDTLLKDSIGNQTCQQLFNRRGERNGTEWKGVFNSVEHLTAMTI